MSTERPSRTLVDRLGHYGGICDKTNGSLVGYGFEAANDLIPLEIESNDDAATAQPRALCETSYGWTRSADVGATLERRTPELLAYVEAVGVSELLTASFSDWSIFEVTQVANITVTLALSEPLGSPALDLVLFDERTVIDHSFADNLRELEWQWCEPQRTGSSQEPVTSPCGRTGQMTESSPTGSKLNRTPAFHPIDATARS